MVPAGPTAGVQMGKIPPGSASDLEDAVAVAQAQAVDRLLAQLARKEEDPLEQWNEPGDA